MYDDYAQSPQRASLCKWQQHLIEQSCPLRGVRASSVDIVDRYSAGYDVESTKRRGCSRAGHCGDIISTDAKVKQKP
jgi:hypothetical protein